MECCLQKKTPVVSGRDGFAVQRIIEGIYRSAEYHKLVDMEMEIVDV